MVGFLAFAAMRAARSGSKIVFRRFSSYSVIGKNLDVVIPEKYCTPFSVWKQNHSLLSLIPQQSLIRTILPNKKFLVEDEQTRHVIWTAALQCAFAQLRGVSLKDLFQFENLGVVTDINVLCFKSIVAVNSEFSSLDEFQVFIDLILANEHATMDNLPSEWDSLFTKIRDTPRDSLERMKEIIYHPCFFSNEQYATFCIDTHRILRHEMEVRNEQTQAHAILRNIDGQYNDASVVGQCKTHFLLSRLLGIHGPRGKKTGSKKAGSKKSKKKQHRPVGSVAVRPVGSVSLCPVGSVAVDSHRIGVVHSIEKQLIRKIGKSAPKALLSSYTRTDVIQLYRYQFHGYAERVIFAFRQQSLLERLDLETRKPIPSLLYI